MTYFYIYNTIIAFIIAFILTWISGGDSKSMMGLYYTKLDIVARRYCACVRSFFRYAIFE